MATIAIVVLAAGSSGPGFICRGVNGATRRADAPSPPNSSPISNGPGPERALARHADAAEGVDRRQRPHRGPVLGDDRGRAEPAHQRRRHRPGAGPPEPSANSRRRVERRRPERRIRVLRPALVAAVGEVEEDRRRHDRHRRARRGGRARAPGAGPPRPSRRVEPEGRAAREHQRVDRADQPPRRQQVGLARPRRPAAHVDPRDERRVGGQHRHARLQPRVGGVADLQPRHVGDQVAPPRPHHSRCFSTAVAGSPCSACPPARSAAARPRPAPPAVLDAGGHDEELARPSRTVRSRSSMSSSPLRTRKKSSVSGCACQTNAPSSFTTITSLPLNPATIRGATLVERRQLLRQIHRTVHARSRPGLSRLGIAHLRAPHYTEPGRKRAG